MRHLLNLPAILNILGLLLVMNGALMLLGLPFSWYYDSGDFIPILLSGLITAVVGGLMWYTTNGKMVKDIKKRDGYVIVTFGWILMSLFGSIPYLLSGAIPDFTNAFFETISGLTTTGASILNDIEALPAGILFWRSMTQWIGGMGIIVLTIAILPFLGIGGMELFVAEAPGPTNDKLHPRITETAKRLWAIYVMLTAVEMVLLMFGGMSFFDSVNHSLTTMATGGFSTKQASVAYWDSPYIQYVITLFMFLAGTNFTITYFALKGRMKAIWESDEFKWYLIGTVILTVVVSFVVYFNSNTTIEKAFRDSLFQVVSIVTTTGFASADYTLWHPFLTLMFFILLFSGASAGSTSGGLKIIRFILLFKNSIVVFKRKLHARAIVPVRINRKAVQENIIYNVLAFFLVYIVLFALSALVMTAMGMDMESAMGAVATSIGNVGPGIGTVGPSSNFFNVPTAGKWFLSFLMLLGRLELFTVLILFTPYFWKRN